MVQLEYIDLKEIEMLILKKKQLQLNNQLKQNQLKRS